MKGTSPIYLVVIAALTATLPCRAGITVALEPGSQSIDAGGLVALDLVISGLADHASPSLGAFDFELSYNPAVLSPTSLAFGSGLDLGTLGSLQESSLATPGLIHLDEVSFESATDLDDQQGGSFTLATLNFRGVGAGLSSIEFVSGSLSDEIGETSLPFETTTGRVQVRESDATPVPDSGPSAAWLALGLWGWLVLWRATSHALHASQRSLRLSRGSSILTQRRKDAKAQREAQRAIH